MSDKPSSTVDYHLEIVAFYNRWIKVVKLLLKDRVNRFKFKEVWSWDWFLNEGLFLSFVEALLKKMFFRLLKVFFL